MDTSRMTTPMLAACQLVLLWSMMPGTVSAAGASAPVTETEPVYPYQLAQQVYLPSKWPGENATPSGTQGMTGPGNPPMMGQGVQGMRGPGMSSGGQRMMGPGMGPGGMGMMGPGMGPGGQGMMGPGMGPDSQGMMEPGMGPGGQSMMGSSMGPGGQGMMGPGMGPGGQSMMGSGMGPGGQGMRGPGMGPGNQGMMAGLPPGSPVAMFNAIGTLDLSDEQRDKYDAINKGLTARMQEITGRMKAESEKLRKLQEEQMRIGKTLNDLRGHMMQATMDAANHAEELLTDEQRQAMVDQGRHIMMQPGRLPYAGAPGGKTE